MDRLRRGGRDPCPGQASSSGNPWSEVGKRVVLWKDREPRTGKTEGRKGQIGFMLF